MTGPTKEPRTPGDGYVPSFLRDEATAERIAAIFRNARARRLADNESEAPS